MPRSLRSSRPTRADERGSVAVLSSIIVASTLAACTLSVLVAARIEAAARLQWNADAVALASAHADDATVERLARALGIGIVGSRGCGPDVCVTVSGRDGSAVSRASGG